MSLIMMCYVLVTLSSKLKHTKQYLTMPFLLGTIFLCVICEYICECKHISGRIVLVLFFFSYVYFNAQKFYHWIINTNFIADLIVAIVFNGITCWLFYADIIGDSNRLLRDWVVLIAALSWFPMFCKIPMRKPKVMVVDYISAISFEMYLVHHPFILGKYSLIDPNTATGGVVTVLLITIILSSLLHNLSKKISCRIKL